MHLDSRAVGCLGGGVMDQSMAIQAMSLQLPFPISLAFREMDALFVEVYEHLLVKWDALMEAGWAEDSARWWILNHVTVYRHPKTSKAIVVWSEL